MATFTVFDIDKGNPNSADHNEKMQAVIDMVTDFNNLFPWLHIFGFGTASAAFDKNMKRYVGKDANHKDIVRTAPGWESYNMPIEVIYTILKLSGVDVSKYGFKEYWEV